MASKMVICNAATTTNNDNKQILIDGKRGWNSSARAKGYDDVEEEEEEEKVEGKAERSRRQAAGFCFSQDRSSSSFAADKRWDDKQQERGR